MNMTIVVKKVPKALRGIVKFVFGIKDEKQANKKHYLKQCFFVYKNSI